MTPPMTTENDMQEEQPAYDMSIHHNPDAQAWARFYCETFPDADEGLMQGWFANAMMAMHDWQAQVHEQALATARAEGEALREENARLKEALEAISIGYASRRYIGSPYAGLLARNIARAALSPKDASHE